MRFKMKYIYDIPKTVYFNFRVLPFKKAIKLPFYISHSVHFDINNFKNILIESPVIKRFMIRFVNGGSEDIIPNRYGLICLKEKGKIIFHGDAQFAAGCSVKCGGGCLKLEPVSAQTEIAIFPVWSILLLWITVSLAFM